LGSDKGNGGGSGHRVGSNILSILCLAGALWGQLLPSLQQLWATLQPILEGAIPLLKYFGIALGALLVGWWYLTGVINGLISGITTILPYISRIIGGVVEIFQGFVTTVGAYLAIIGDLFSGNTDKLAEDWAKGWNGIVEIWKGIWDIAVMPWLGRSIPFCKP